MKITGNAILITGSAHRPAAMNRTTTPAEKAASDQFEAPIGEAAGLRAKGDAMFLIMNRG